MTSESENYEKNLNKGNTVTSVGNSWIVCDSKTRPGFKYYFNTLTGEAVWNLSPIEIEKAKKFTKALPIDEIEKYPEPLDPPMDPPESSQSRDFKKQTTNNMYPNQFPTEIPSIFPVNLLNGLAGNSGFNPNMWATATNSAGIPQGQVLLVAFPQPMNIQSSQEYAQSLHTNYQSISYSQDQEGSQNSGFQDNLFRGNRMQSNWDRGVFPKRNFQRSQVWKQNNPDLRQKLMRKRSKSQSCESRYDQDVACEEMDVKIQPTGAMLNNITQDESPSKYDLSVLKKLKSSQSKAQHWFIVTDTEIILNNFPFLNKITDPDQNCYLMVPDHILTELQDSAYNGNDVRTRRIYRFLSEQINSELAFRGEDVTELANNDTEKTFITCTQLAMRNNVILLSNDIRLYKYKNQNDNVHVLTMNELRMILKDEPMKRVSVGRTSPTLAIKIIVPNKRKPEQNDNPVSLRTRITKTPDVEIRPSIHSVARKKESLQSATVPSSSTQLVQTGGQASDSRYHFQDIDTPIPLNTPEPVTFDRGSEDSYFYNNDKQNEIKLNRHFPVQKANVDGNTQKKQYRWRKQRGNSNLTNISNSLCPISETAADKNVMNNKADTLVSTCKNSESNITEAPLEASFSPLARSSDRSSVISSLSKKIGHPNVVIEETSTSGVISNTNDSESMNSNSLTKDKKVIKMCNYVMFELAGQSMEDVLRTRREEWVLRFVQIMEEVLREKLRENSQSKDYSEPWATDLPELTRCIIKKFSDYFNVVDAANRLSFTLYRLCDDKGNVSPNIEPSQYMDMYSYGVYLIEALKDVTNGCEDLKTADESLKKLLYDIQNANLDSSHNDTFTDELHESVANVSESIVADEELVQPDAVSTKEITDDGLNDKQSSNNPYQLRSRKSKPTQVKQILNKPQEKVPTIVEATFFSSLQLEKSQLVKKLVFNDDSSKSAQVVKTPPNVQISLNSPINPESPKIPQPPKRPQSPKVIVIPQPPEIPQSPNIPQSPKIPQSPNILQSPKIPQSPNFLQGSPVKQLVQAISNQETQSVRDTGDGGEKNTAPVTVEPVVVRNFTSLPEFENLLSGRSYPDIEHDDEGYLDVHYDDTEYPPQHYDDTELEDGEIVDQPEVQDTPNIDKSLNECEEVKKFRWFIRDFIGEIQESLEAGKKLCVEFVQDLKNSQESTPEMDIKMNEACAKMLNISNSLNGILDRESRSKNNILQLKKARLEEFVPNEQLRLEYTNIITKCRDQTFNYHKNVTLIMKRAGKRISA